MNLIGRTEFLNAALACSLALPAVGVAGDWPTYLGPERDGRAAAGEKVRWDWAENEPDRVWEADLGKGMAGFVVSGGRAITTGNSGDEDTVWCFDAESGKVLWRHTYPEKLDPKYYAGGTSATPVIDGDRVYSVSKNGLLFCLDLASGEVVWKVDYQADLDGRKQDWGWAASPLVVGNALIVDPGARRGAVAALDKATGKVLWKSGDSTPGYSTPVLYEADGGPAVAVFHGKELVGYRVRDGEVLFKAPWKTKYDVNASNPHYLGGRFFVASGYGTGGGFITTTGRKPEVTEPDKGLQLQFQNSLLVGDRVLGVFGDGGMKAQLRWVDTSNGRALWSEPFPGNRGNTILVGDRLIVLTETGELVGGRASDAGFEELSRLQVLPKTCWAMPALANGRLYARNNDGKAVCLDLR